MFFVWLSAENMLQLGWWIGGLVDVVETFKADKVKKVCKRLRNKRGKKEINIA